MSTDKTLADECTCPSGDGSLRHPCPSHPTLADVQPGGRVRLGDQLVLAKLVGAAGLMLAEIDTCGHEVYPAYRHTLYEAWEEGKAALSAQPSPGGQDAPRNVDDKAVRQFLAGRAPTDVHRDEILSGAYDHTLWFDHIRELMTALAARQPVRSSTVSDDMMDVVDRLGSEHDEVDPRAWDHMLIYAPTEKLAARLAARQPVGEPVAWMTHHDEPMLFPTAAEAAAYCEDDEQPVPLFRSPAQAVALADFKALYRAYVRLLESGRDRIRDLGGTCDPVDVMEANDVDLQAARRVIDSQAVGNG